METLTKNGLKGLFKVAIHALLNKNNLHSQIAQKNFETVGSLKSN